jgi:hypothetical protein
MALAVQTVQKIPQDEPVNLPGMRFKLWETVLNGWHKEVRTTDAHRA